MANHALTLIGWLGTVIVALVVGRFAAVEPGWDAYLLWAGAAGCACIVIYAIGRWRVSSAGQRTPASPQGLQGATLGLGAALTVTLALVAGTYGPRWDVTPNRVYQLSSDTREILRRLDAPVRVRLFVEDADLPVYRDLVDEYAAASTLISVQEVDVERQSALVRQYDVQEYGTSVLEYKGRFELVRGASEQELTNALVRLREGRTRKIYFTTGHAERDIASSERVGYSQIVAALRRDNFIVETLNFTEQSEVPADATLAVVAGPRADFFTGEIEALRRYVARGGAILFLVDPFEDLKRYITESGLALFMMDPASVSGTGELRNLTAFVREQGAMLGNDVVVDTSEMGQFIGTDASVPVAVRYPAHPITDGLTALSAYPMARSVTAGAVEGRTAAAFIETGDRTWSETSIQQLGAGQLSMDQEDGDRPGPVSLGVAIAAASRPTRNATVPARETRLAVVGDSDFAANYSANVPGNAEIFRSITRWLAQDEVAEIPSRLPEARTLTITATQRTLVSWLALGLLPGVAVGIAAHLRKR